MYVCVCVCVCVKIKHIRMFGAVAWTFHHKHKVLGSNLGHVML